jgi:caffeoyl-CoA O-methyltransferase
MSAEPLEATPELIEYVRRVGVREPAFLARLREETQKLPEAIMQIAPERGALMALLVRMLGARRALEVGTFTGYSSTCVALALPDDGQIVCCDVSREWTDVARRTWQDAGVAHKVDLRLAPATETLSAMIDAGEEGSFDFAFIDANKGDYPAYYEAALRLVRRGGLIAIDNTLRAGRVLDPQDDDTKVIAALNAKIATDERVEVAMVPMSDGLTLVLAR